ncbi:MAG: hypothetical protein V2A76_01050 [Planctomycetota bacterium]
MAILLYLPNRVFDILDIVRARLRVGPGWSFSVRATELLDLNMVGAHATVFVGLRGPGHEPRIPWPFGVETMECLEASLADSTDEHAVPGVVDDTAGLPQNRPTVSVTAHVDGQLAPWVRTEDDARAQEKLLRLTEL